MATLSSETIEPGAVLSLRRGQAPLLISMPHVGTELLSDMKARLTDEAAALPDTDWHVEKLYAFAAELDVTLLEARLSRYVIDLNRDPSGASLYPGQSVTELCPRTTFAEEPIYRRGEELRDEEREQRMLTCFSPYHDALRSELERIRAQHGYAVLLDGHSICSRVPRFFEGRLPDLNLGTADGRSTASNLERVASEVLASSGLSWVVNGRFKGGYITRRYGQPAQGVHALQLEIAQACYMDEDPPYPFSVQRAGALIQVLRRLVEALLHTKPAVETSTP